MLVVVDAIRLEAHVPRFSAISIPRQRFGPGS